MEECIINNNTNTIEFNQKRIKLKKQIKSKKTIKTINLINKFN